MTLREFKHAQIEAAKRQYTHYLLSHHATYVQIARRNTRDYIHGDYEVLLECGDDSVQSNMFSGTKSIVGLYILLAYINNDVPIDVDLSQLFASYSTMSRNLKKLSSTPIVDYVNHMGALVTGMQKPKSVGLLDIMVAKLHKVVDALSLVEREIWFDEMLSQIGKHKTEFDYNNTGSQLAAIYFEILMRFFHVNEVGVTQKDIENDYFTLKNACTTLFFAAPEQVVWPMGLEGYSHQHSAGFSGVRTTGRVMVALARVFLSLYRSAFLYLLGETYMSPSGVFHRNTHIVEANDKNVNPGCKTEMKYRYSFGWWLPQIPENAYVEDIDITDAHKNRKDVVSSYVSAIGMFGQYITINLRNDVYFVRKSTLSDNWARIMGRKPMDADPSFIWHSHCFLKMVECVEAVLEDSSEARKRISQVVKGFTDMLIATMVQEHDQHVDL